MGNYCNYDCSYCHKELKSGNAPFPGFDKLKIGLHTLLDQASFFDIIKIELLGGEVTASESIKQMMQLDTNPMVKFRLYSNGSADVEWWKNMRSRIYEIDLTYHPDSDLDHFYNVVDSLNSISGENINVIVAASPSKWDHVITAYDKLSKFNPSLQMLYSNFTRGNNQYLDYTEDQWKQYYSLSGVNSNNVSDMSETKEFKKINLLNNFYGHLCYAGYNQIVINQRGDVYRGWCYSNETLGNIFSNTFKLDQKPRPCPKKQCNNGFDQRAHKSSKSWGLT
jgi:sulfatase maturation enzyme AslB (radical SAM superfamily)